MAQTKHTCTECGYSYSSVTGAQMDECPDCGNDEWRKEVVAP